MSLSQATLDQLCVNTVRMLAADAVEKARSGHPGLPLGAAAPAYTLWTKFLRHNPANPRWINRDRFVLSAGHGSALLYALLYLTGYPVSLEDLKNFRQLGSKTPGHPEYDPDMGVECTTGPLGQGFAMAVGMALAERRLAARFNKPGFPVVDHCTYVLASDGDLMEGVSAEAASFAGHLGLGKLICLYDDNHISIEGDTALTFTEDTGKRFEAYGWRVLKVEDGNDLGSVERAIQEARTVGDRPSFIMIRTHIGFGSPKQDQASAHGEPLGAEALAATKATLGWPPEPPFFVPDEALAHFRKAVESGSAWEREWKALAAGYREAYPQEGQEFERVAIKGELPAGWDRGIPRFSPADGAMATRAASGKALNALAKHVPNLLGGSADLAPSNNTLIAGARDQSKATPTGRNIRFGVREFAMAATVNGMALHGGIIPYAGTFLIFSDYMRPALRLAALMNVRSLFVFTHDSIGVGEDGPTHQPVEQIASLRAMPNFTVFRPADANETAEGWRIAMTRNGPMALVLTRQKLPVLDPDACDVRTGAARGAYVLADADGAVDLLFIATGSEVHLALEARSRLAQDLGVRSRVVSMPSWELFTEQPAAYRESVLPKSVKKRISIEAGASLGWERWVGDEGIIIGLDRFGASAPGDQVMKQFGFSVDNVVEKALELLQAP
jgi:transketolase